MVDITMLERKNSPVFYQALVEQFTKIANNPAAYTHEMHYHLLHTLPDIDPIFILTSDVLAKWRGLAIEQTKKGAIDIDVFKSMPEEVIKEINDFDPVVSLNVNGKDYTVLKSTPLSEATIIGSFSASLGMNVHRVWSDVRTLIELDAVPELDIRQVTDDIAIEIKELNALADMMNLVASHLHEDEGFLRYAGDFQSSLEGYSKTPHSEEVGYTLMLLDDYLQEAKEGHRHGVTAPDMDELTSFLKERRQQVINQLAYIIQDGKPAPKTATFTI